MLFELKDEFSNGIEKREPLEYWRSIGIKPNMLQRYEDKLGYIHSMILFIKRKDTHRVIELLKDEKSVGELMIETGLAQAYVSTILKFLREYGLVDSEKRGSRVYNKLNRKNVYELSEKIKGI